MKKIIIFTSIIALIIISLSLSSFSFRKAKSDVTSTAPPTLVPSPTSTPNIQSETEVSLLKLEVELLKSHNQQLLETIYWSIGAVFTLALFVVGAGWYVNFRLYEKDKIELQRNLEMSLTERLNKEETELQERFESEKESLQNIAQKSGEAAATKLHSQFEDMKWDLEYMQYKMLEEQAKSWRSQKVYANELSRYFDMLKIAQKLYRQNWEWLLSDALQGMQNSLRSGAKPDVEKVREITKVIDSLDKNYSIEVSRLKDLLVASKNETG